MSMKAETDSELKPCPFCGGQTEIVLESDYFTVRCTNTECYSVIDDWRTSEDEATKAWNRRIKDD